MRVAFAVMPYHSTRYGSIQCGLLKAYLARAGIASDVHYLNLPFARRLGVPYYEALAHEGRFLPEWSFAQDSLGRSRAALARARAELKRLAGSRGFAPDKYWPILDEAGPFLDECLESVDWGRYDLVGFSSVFQTQQASLALARRLKDRWPRVKVVFGGPNVEGPMGRELLRAFPFVDYVVDGEGEEALLGLCRGLPEPGPVPGVVRRAGGSPVPPPRAAARVPLDELPFPDYDEFFAQMEAAGLAGGLEPQLYFESSRGCWWGERKHCTFCGLNDEAIAYRSKSPERLLAEIEHLARRYRVNQLSATDNILDLRYLETLFPALKRRIEAEGLHLNMFFETKSNLRRAQVRALRESGVGRVQPGIESLSTGLLSAMRKGVTAIQNVQTLRACREFGLESNWVMIYGFPGETSAHHEEVLALLPRLTHLTPPENVQRFLLDRFSPYFVEPAKWNISVRGPRADYALVYPPGADVSELAYRFDYDCPDAPADGTPSLEALKDFMRRWQGGLGQSTFFHYAKGPGFVRLYDYRLPDASARAPRYRGLTLTGWRAEAYSWCVDVRGSGETAERCAQAGGAPVGRAEVRAQFEQWHREGLGMLEGDSFLSLALPVPRDSVRFLERCQSLQALETMGLERARA